MMLLRNDTLYIFYKTDFVFPDRRPAMPGTAISTGRRAIPTWLACVTNLGSSGSKRTLELLQVMSRFAGRTPSFVESWIVRVKCDSTLRPGKAAKYGAVLYWPEFAARGDASVSLTTIFFDAGGTLVYPDIALTEWALASRGIFPADDQRYAAEREAKRQLDEARAEHQSVDAQYWDIYYFRLFHELGMAEDAELRAALVAATRKGTNWRQVRPDTREVLARLKRRYRIGLISNSDGSVRRLFELLGLDDCFDSFTDSHLCGCEKPDPRIFECAMASLGAMPQQSLYVGDIYSIDFLGAQGVGMGAVLMDLAGAYRDTPYPRVESLAEFESRLEDW